MAIDYSRFYVSAKGHNRLDEQHMPGVLFMGIEVNRLKLVPQLQQESPRANFVPRFISHWG